MLMLPTGSLQSTCPNNATCDALQSSLYHGQPHGLGTDWQCLGSFFSAWAVFFANQFVQQIQQISCVLNAEAMSSVRRKLTPDTHLHPVEMQVSVECVELILRMAGAEVRKPQS